MRFTEMRSASGIDLALTCGRMPSREILEVDGGGIALFDFDNDGDLDVFLANGATLDEPENGPGSRLYANRGDGTFEDITDRVGIRLRRWAMGVAVGDYDGDGWDDLYVTCFGPNVLLKNVPAGPPSTRDAGTPTSAPSVDSHSPRERAGARGPIPRRRFIDVTAEAGVGDPRWSTSAAFADLDGDGDLDLFVVNYLEFDAARPPSRAGKFFKGIPVMAGPRGLKAQPDTLYENLGNGRFRDVTRASGCIIDTGLDYGLGLRIFDFDRDGRPDIFVGNDSTENSLFHNQGGLRFKDVAGVAGVAANGEGTTQANMGVDLADLDGNGYPDLFSTVFSDDTYTLQLNLGDGFFDDRTAQYGLASVTRPFLGWGCGFYDFDLDGDEDLFIANGHVYPEADGPDMGSAWAQQVLLFERRGNRFERVSSPDASRPERLNATAASTRPGSDPGDWLVRRYHGRATAFGDIDGDGDVDILMTTLNGPVHVFRNEAPAGGALVVQLQAPPPNRHGYGSLVELETPVGVQRRWITGGGSYQSFDEPVAFFGLGGIAQGAKIKLRVTWPDGKTTDVSEVPRNARVVVSPGDARPVIRPLAR